MTPKEFAEKHGYTVVSPTEYTKRKEFQSTSKKYCPDLTKPVVYYATLHVSPEGFYKSTVVENFTVGLSMKITREEVEDLWTIDLSKSETE